MKGHQLTVLAPEIPLLVGSTGTFDDLFNQFHEDDKDDDQVTAEAEGEDKTTVVDEALPAAEGEKVEGVPAATPEPQLLSSLAHAPSVLPAPLSPLAFSPTTFTEKNTQCRLMSKIDTTLDDSLSYSFEESRFYHSNKMISSGETVLAMPARPESTLGSLWTWGSAAKGQLGVGDKLRRASPTFVSTDFTTTIVQVACGDHHSACVDTDGDVWAWGHGSSGNLGHGEFRSSIEPVFVDTFVDIKINMVACGKSHTAALTEHGTIWTWGSNHAGQLGYSGIDKTNVPKEVFAVKEAVFVACGGNNTAALTKYGEMYTMGCNTYGQRGIGKRTKHPIFEPTRVQFPGSLRIKYTSIGQGFMGALSMAGVLLTWGRNLNSQCGNGFATDVYTPTMISASIPIIHFACGDTHAAYVTEKGEVFTWGWGPFGQLGHPQSANNSSPTSKVPQQVEAVEFARMVQCGGRHTTCVMGLRGKVWAWGANDLGQIGIPLFDYSYEDEDEEGSDSDEDAEYVHAEGASTTWMAPQILESMSRVSMIACGKDHTVAIVEESNVPIQFAKDGNDEALCYWLENNPKFRDLDDAALKAELNNIRDDELGSDYSLLHWATYFANEDVLDLLSGQWMDPNITDCFGDTPLHICAERDIPFCVPILLESGGKPDLKNKKGKTAIHISVESHTIDVLRELVENSISDKSVVDEFGNTPLHYAIQLRYFDMAKYLIESAAQPQILDKSGKTALDYCNIREASYFKSLAQKNDVFISYAHVDIKFALKIKEFLESYAIKCWMDETRLEAGSDWRLDIGNGLLSSRLVLYVASRASVVSDWCIKELHMAKKHRLTIIPIWYQKVEVDSEVNSLVFGRSFLDFSDPKQFNSRGKRLSKKLKHVLGLIKQSKPNPYLEIPILTTEQLWKQLYLTILIESHSCIDAASALERVLHSSAIFSCAHTIDLAPSSPYYGARQDNLDHAWGIVFLIKDLKQVGASIETWWKYAEDRGKRVYLCMVTGDATHVKTEDLPTQALKQTSVPIFYLENITSLQQLVFFVHLAQREEFMAKQVGVMQTRLTDAVETIKSNDQEIITLRKRFYIE